MGSGGGGILDAIDIPATSYFRELGDLALVLPVSSILLFPNGPSFEVTNIELDLVEEPDFDVLIGEIRFNLSDAPMNREGSV